MEIIKIYCSKLNIFEINYFFYIFLIRILIDSVQKKSLFLQNGITILTLLSVYTFYIKINIVLYIFKTSISVTSLWYKFLYVKRVSSIANVCM